MWEASYREEHASLLGHEMFDILSTAEYKELREKHGRALPSMCILVMKKDEHGRPGNHKTTYWSKGDYYTPLTLQETVHLLVSMALEHGHTAKQGNCKNTSCHPTLPDDELVLVNPPHCPISKLNTYWRLSKTIYEQHWSLHH